MGTTGTDKGLRVWVSDDGKHAAASMRLSSGGGMKTGAGGHPQAYGWHG